MKLHTKLIALFLPAALLSGAVITILTNQAVHTIVLKEAGEAGLVKMHELANAVVPGLSARDENLLLPLLVTSRQQTNALYAMALDPTGHVVAHTDVGETGKADDGFAATAGKAGFRVVQANGEPVLEAWVPVWSRPADPSASFEQFLMLADKEGQGNTRLGTVRMGWPFQNTMDVENRISRRVALIILTTGGLVLFLALILMRTILRPVRYLAQATERISSGDYGSPVPVFSSDELGELAGGFNRMSQDLSSTTVSKNFLNNILKSMLDPLLVIKPDGTLQMLNPAALRLSGYAQEELLGKPATLLFAGENAEAIELYVTGAGQEDFVSNIKGFFLTKSRERIPILFSGSVLQDKDAHAIGIIAVAKDMTQLKKMETTVRRAEKLSAVGHLASGIAHEINNPLGVILGFAQGALWDLPEGNGLEFPLKSIEREAMRCKKLVTDLLTFSRVSKTEREPLDLNAAVDGAMRMVSAQAKLGDIAIRQDLATDLPRILGSPDQIQQVIINLANNALDAMNKQGTLTIKTELLHIDQRSWVGLSVSDTGPGIPADVLPRIFEPFFTTKPVGEGTGLGLGLVHEIVQKHSGTIDVQSRPGSTVFMVKLPVRREDDPSVESPPDPYPGRFDRRDA